MPLDRTTPEVESEPTSANQVRRAGRFSPRAWPLWVYAVLAFVLSVVLSPIGTRGAGAGDPDTLADPGALERAFQEVVEKVSPSVVGIRTRRSYAAAVPSAEGAGGAGTVEQSVVINGAGTILRADGTILTNEHVIQRAGEIQVVLHDGRKLEATVAAADARSDLAILRIDAHRLTPARLCDWESVARGQWTIAIGNPYGLGNDGHLSVSVGVISNLGRRLPGLGEVDDRLYADMIQTTAAIHPGNSGGPLFNIRGEVIGVVTAVHARSVDDEGVGFAIPLTPGKRRVIEQLLAGKPVEYGYLGLTVRALEPAERQAAALESSGGVLVEQVEPGGPGAKAGVQVGDIVTHCGRRLVQAPMQLADWVGQTPVGQELELTLRRGRMQHTVRACVQARQVSRVAWMRAGAVVWRGMRLADLTANWRESVEANAGEAGVVVIDVAPGSSAARAHIRIGDVVERVEDTPVGQVLGFLQTVRGKTGSVRLQIRQRGSVTVPP